MEDRLLMTVYQRWLASNGPQHWWPAQSPFEVVVGAVLTQNTAWTNVERAIANLRAANVLDPRALWAMPHDRLAELIRPAGYFNVKASRLRHAVEWVLDAGHGSLAGLAPWDTDALRSTLLAVHGIGPETADSILLYALNRPVFVIDAYTRRIFGRIGAIDPKSRYETLRHHFETRIPRDVSLYNDYHAQVVLHAKHWCRVRPVCIHCVLRDCCQAAGR